MRGLADDLRLMSQGVLVPRNPFEDLGAYRLDAHRRVREVVGDRRRRDDHGDGPVAWYVAVVEPERGGDRPRREIVVHRHRIPVDGSGVERSVAPPVERDQSEHLAGGTVAVHVLRGVHADPVGGGHGAERSAPFAERAGNPLRPFPAATTVCRGGLRCSSGQDGEGGLPHGPEAQDMAAEAGGHGQGGRYDRTARTREVAASVDPRRADAQRLLDGAGAPLAHAAAAHARIGRQPVDVLDREPGVGDRGEAGIDCE